MSDFKTRIEKSLKKPVFFKPKDAPSRVPHLLSTSSLTINRALGGGAPGGRITQVYGPSAVYKSTCLYDLIAETQKLVDAGEHKTKGKKIALFDTERSHSESYLKKRGIDTESDDFYIVDNLKDADELMVVLREMLKSEEFILICLDSLTGMVLGVEKEKAADGVQKLVGKRARFFSFWFNELNDCNTGGTALVFANQIRDNIKDMMSRAQSDKRGHSPTGGHAPKFFSSEILELQHQTADTTEDLQEIPAPKKVQRKTFESWLISVRVEKTRNSGNDNMEMVFRYSPRTSSLDYEEEVITLGLIDGFVRRKGAWFSYKLPDGTEGKLGQGRANARMKLVKDRELFQALRGAITDRTLKEYSG